MSELSMDSATSGHTTNRMSARRPRIEVITGVERRRRWSFEQKRAIVMESQLPHASVGRRCSQAWDWHRATPYMAPPVIEYPPGWSSVFRSRRDGG